MPSRMPQTLSICSYLIQNGIMEKNFFLTTRKKNQESEDRQDTNITELRSIATTFNFGYFLIRGRIVCGAHSFTLREKLFRETDLI